MRLVAGDFNARPDSALLQELRDDETLGDVRDAFTLEGEEARPSTLVRHDGCVDYILSVATQADTHPLFTSPAVVLKTPHPETGTLPSDHYGVATTLVPTACTAGLDRSHPSLAENRMTSKPSPPGRRILIAVVTGEPDGASRRGANSTTRNRRAASSARDAVLLGAHRRAGVARTPGPPRLRRRRHAIGAPRRGAQGRQRPGNLLRRGSRHPAPQFNARPPLRRHLRASSRAAMAGYGTSPACASREVRTRRRCWPRRSPWT